MSQSPSDDPQTGAWMTLAEAARLLGVEVRTIDRRGYAKRREPGRKVEVWIPTAVSDRVSDVTETASDSVSDVSSRALALSDHVSDIVRQHTAPLLEALERSEARARDLEREAGHIEEQNAALRRVVDAVRQMSDADRRDADALRQALEAERERRLAAEQERDRLRNRRWWKPSTW